MDLTFAEGYSAIHKGLLHFLVKLFFLDNFTKSYSLFRIYKKKACLLKVVF